MGFVFAAKNISTYAGKCFVGNNLAVNGKKKPVTLTPGKFELKLCVPEVCRIIFFRARLYAI